MAFYIYHPNSTFKFGYAIDPRKPDDDKSTNGFFEWQENSIDNNNAGADVEFSIKEITSKSDLFEKLSLDINLEAKYTFFKGKASFSWEKEVNISKTSIVYVVHGKKTYYPESYNGYLDLSEKGKRAWAKACQSNKILEFQRIAGTDIVTKIRRGNSISLVYVFNCSSTSMREKIKSKLEAEWSTGSAKVDFKRELYSVDENMRIDVIGLQTGVSNLTLADAKLSEIITITPGDMPAVKQIIANILANVSKEDRDNSPIIELNTKSITEIEDIALSDFIDEFRTGIELNQIIDRKVVELRELNLDNEYMLEDVQEYKKNWNSVDFREGSLQIIDNAIEELKKNSKIIYEAFRKCINAKSIADTEFVITSIPRLLITDILKEPYVIPLKWGDDASVWCGGEKSTVQSNFYPVVHIKFPNAVKHLFVVKNNVRVAKLTNEQVRQIAKQEGSFKDFWKIQHTSYDIYTWGCFPHLMEAEKRNRHEGHRNGEANNSYSLEIVNDEGKSHFVNISNPNSPMEISNDIFAAIPQEHFANFTNNNSFLKFV